MDETPVVTVFLRNRGEVLLLRRSEAVGSYRQRWGAVAGHVEDDPERSARREIREETGIDPGNTVLVRAGDPFTVTDDDLDTRWVVHPFLFDSSTRTVETNWETDRAEWASPTQILDRETVPELWTSYDRVRPTVETVASDADHGSAYISLRALEVLRDEAALARSRNERFEHVEDVARELLAARPAMTVVRNRVNRVMATTERSPPSVEEAAHDAVHRARCVDSEAAEHAARFLDGARVATLSRSGTVLRAFAEATPEAALVAESRPGSEGVDVAETLAGDDNELLTDDDNEPLADEGETAVTLTTDAAFAHELAAWDAELLVVGADSILADGRLVNKVGTRAAAVAARHEGVRMLVVTASDKIAPDTAYDLEMRDPGEVYDGPSPLSVTNPTFDLTPSECVDVVVTERGELDAADVAQVAAEHRALSEWDETT